MGRSIPRAAIAALVGAVAGAACITLAVARRPVFTFELDRPLPRFVTGFYPPERSGEETFAWSRDRAVVTLSGLDRRSEWVCSIRFRGGRPAPFVQPHVEIAADGVRLAAAAATNEYQDLEATLPSRPTRPGAILTVSSTPVFVPGPSDSRQLGVQLDRLACRPSGTSVVFAPRRAVAAASLAAGGFGAALGLTGVAPWVAVGGALVVAVFQAVPLAAGAALYDTYPDMMMRLAMWIAIALVVAVAILERWRGTRLSPAARFVMAFSAGVLYLKLLALLHPLKSVVDALFHAHRFEWVLDGRFYFTQPMPDGVQFPYAVALYLFAAPWSVFSGNYQALLRIVVCASEAVAAALLYPAIAKTWGDRWIAALAVVLFHAVPAPYVVAGNANLTFAFGESAALAAVIAIPLVTLGSKRRLQAAALASLASLGFLSHVGIFPLLLCTLVLVGLLYRFSGVPRLHAPSRVVLLSTVVAAIFSIVSYYGHFSEVYKTLDRVRARVSAAPAPGAPSPTADANASPAGLPLHVRAVRALAHGARNMGWPLVSLAALGAWRVWADRRLDRLGFVVAAWMLTYLVFLGFAVSVPVEASFLRYLDEFVGRINYSTMPAVVILAAYGAGWAWRAGAAPRLAAAALMIALSVGGIQQWAFWME